MKTLSLFFLVAVISTGSISFGQSFTGKPQYQIEVRRADTVMGKIVVEMFPAIAPNHVRNWDSLVAIKFYDSVAFHRVIPGFMIQGGDPNSRSGPRSTWGYGDPEQQTIDAEFSSVSHRRGILSAARLGNDINSATSQFFICVANPTYLDRQYTIYGKVVSGMEVADSIVKAPRDGSDNPLDKISMFITRIGSNDSATAVPDLMLPVKDSTFPSTTTRVPLRWHKIQDAMLYRIQVATDNAFNDIVADTSVRQIDTTVTINRLTAPSMYYWRVMANNGGKPSEYSPTWNFFIGSLSVKDVENSSLELHVYPNPMKRSTTIHFHLDKGAPVTLSIIDMLGRPVKTLTASTYMATGDHEINFAEKLASGTYFLQLEAGGKAIQERMIVE